MTEEFSRVEADKELSYALDANHHRSVRAVTLQRALAEIDRLRAALTARGEGIRMAAEAPHEEKCPKRHPWFRIFRDNRPPCSCWKAKFLSALAALKETNG